MRTILNLPEQASTIAYEIDVLHYIVIIVTMIGSLAVALACLLFILRYRVGVPHKPPITDDQRKGHTPAGTPYWVEFAVIGFLLALFTGWWVIGFRQYTRMQRPPENALDVYVIGKQWMWSFAYPDGGTSNAVLYVPVNRPVRLIMTSRDVIHSFYVPAFRTKQDVVPGRVTLSWFEATKVGSYDVLCTEYCGTAHSTMRAQVVVLSDEDYARRLEGLPRFEVSPAEYRDPTLAENVRGESISLAEMGQRVATDMGCLRCHTVDGTPHIGPSWARLYDSEVQLTSGQTTIADAGYITESMMDPLAEVRAGFAPIMPSYQGVLTAGQSGALVEYIRSLRDLPLAAEQMPLAPPVDRAEPVELPRAPVAIPPERGFAPQRFDPDKPIPDRTLIDAPSTLPGPEYQGDTP